MFSVRIQNEPIDAECSVTPAGSRGAVVRFTGKVRNDPRAGAALTHLTLEHFPGVTEAEIERIVEQARQRWALLDAMVVHRVGRIDTGEDIVMVETSGAHRKDAYEANAFIMDYLKTEAPFWKQEHHADGSAHWVEARAGDQQARRRWEADSRPRIGALILAGGQGSRMGHRNKGLQRLHGRPMVRHVIDALQPQVDYLAISANRDLPDYDALGLPVFTDETRFSLQGPLAGILSAIPRFPLDLDAILVVPCDTPLLPTYLVSRLAQVLFAPGGPPAAMAATAENLHPSIFLFRPGMLISLVRHDLRPDGLSLRAWLQGCGCATVAFGNAGAFVNVNDADSLQALESRPDGAM